MKYIYPISIGAALLFVFAVGAWQYHGPSTSAYVPSGTGTPATTTSETPSTPTTPTTPAANSYTLADVAKHASPTDCWTTINDSVYNITPFVPMHPGGERIEAVCGIDGTSLFQGQHGSNRQANAELARLKIGTLAQ